MRNILIFQGTAREGNYTQYVTQLVFQQVKKHSQLQGEVISPLDINLKIQHEAQGDKYPKLRKKVQQADAFIIVVPEYNHSFPGSLKLMLDLNSQAYENKPVGVCGVSAGSFGGVRVVESLISVVRALGMIPLSNDVHFSHIQDEVQVRNGTGVFIDEKKWTKRIDTLLESLLERVESEG